MDPIKLVPSLQQRQGLFSPPHLNKSPRARDKSSRRQIFLEDLYEDLVVDQGLTGFKLLGHLTLTDQVYKRITELKNSLLIYYAAMDPLSLIWTRIQLPCSIWVRILDLPDCSTVPLSTSTIWIRIPALPDSITVPLICPHNVPRTVHTSNDQSKPLPLEKELPQL